LIRDKFSFDLPELNSEEDWKNLWTSLISNAELYANHVEKMSAQKLAAPFFNEAYGDYRRNIEGTIEHCYYHLGQISLIRKLITSKQKNEV